MRSILMMLVLLVAGIGVAQEKKEDKPDPFKDLMEVDAFVHEISEFSEQLTNVQIKDLYERNEKSFLGRIEGKSWTLPVVIKEITPGDNGFFRIDFDDIEIPKAKCSWVAANTVVIKSSSDVMKRIPKNSLVYISGKPLKDSPLNTPAKNQQYAKQAQVATSLYVAVGKESIRYEVRLTDVKLVPPGK